MFLEAKIDQKLVDQAYVIQSNLFQSILKNVYVFELFFNKAACEFKLLQKLNFLVAYLALKISLFSNLNSKFIFSSKFFKLD